MALTLVFLGKLADLAGAPEWLWEIEGPLKWWDILDEAGPAVGAELACDRVRVAHNGSVLLDKEALVACDGDEIAFLPPVSGG